MREQMKFEDNVIRVDFRRKRVMPYVKEALGADPFDIFVDSNSRNVDDFCNALLASDYRNEKPI